MFNKPHLFGILFLLLTVSCTEDQFNLIGKQELLINSWLDPYESNCEGSDMFFRPADSPGISPGERNRLDLWADGRAKYAVLSPRDPHRFDFNTRITGTWTFDPEARTLQILDTNGKIRFTFQVRSIAEDELVLAYAENTGYDLPK
jgi:hypothetical protein